MRAAKLLLICLAGPAAAEVMWDESLPANGDLSGDYLNPTQLAPVAAANCVVFGNSDFANSSSAIIGLTASSSLPASRTC